MALALKVIPAFDDDGAIERLSRASPGWQIEYDANGTMLVSPTSSDGGARELEAGMQLGAYAKRYGGKAFGSSAGFRLRDRSVRSPDAAWLSAERLQNLALGERTGFWRICPDVVVEILSASDAWHELLAKLDQYVANGATYAVGIDPYRRLIVERGTPSPNLVLDTRAIIDAGS